MLDWSSSRRTAMHFAEHDAQPDKFGSIPDAMWWAVVTLTTVGYGDVVPITVLGRLIAAGTMLMGLMMLALPIGIVANAFAEENAEAPRIRRQLEHACAGAAIAHSAVEIAEIMPYLLDGCGRRHHRAQRRSCL